jgi:hypothetical protein
MNNRPFDSGPQVSPQLLTSGERIRWGQDSGSQTNTQRAMPQPDFFSGKLRPQAA